MVKIKLIIGSTRPNRFGPQPANWLLNIAKARDDAQYDLVDLNDLNLPLLDEPEVPAKGNYQQPHTKKWANIVADADGFVIVHPEYNYGVSAALKNAIDFLVAEWAYKPVSLVGYGAAAGGAKASAQIREIVANLRMYDLREQILFTNYWQHMNSKGEFAPPPEFTKQATTMLDELVYWTTHMKSAREGLKK